MNQSFCIRLVVVTIQVCMLTKRIYSIMASKKICGTGNSFCIQICCHNRKTTVDRALSFFFLYLDGWKIALLTIFRRVHRSICCFFFSSQRSDRFYSLQSLCKHPEPEMKKQPHYYWWFSVTKSVKRRPCQINEKGYWLQVSSQFTCLFYPLHSVYSTFELLELIKVC